MKTVTEVIAYLEGEGAASTTEQVVEILKALPVRGASTSNGVRRGMLSGVELNEMTLEQLKREQINANSVLYKAVQRVASAETIAKNQARVDAVKARIAELKPEPVAAPVEGGEPTDGANDGAPAEDHNVATEI